jgi:hypothetical protein
VSEIRLIGRSDDGNELLLASKDGTNYLLVIDDELRALVNQPRLIVVTNEDELSLLTVKEVQSRLRSGESIDSIVRSSDWSPQKIEKFSGPIMQERAYVIGLALTAQLRREKHSPTLSAATISQLAPRGVDMTLVEWNTWRLPDGSWNIILFYPTKDGSISEANWTFNLSNRSLEALDQGAAWIAGDELDLRTTTPSHGIVYPSTSPPPRLVSVREPADQIDTRDGITETEKRDGKKLQKRNSAFLFGHSTMMANHG